MFSHNSGTTTTVTVTTSATLLHAGVVEPINAFSIANISAVTVYWGYDDSIAASTAFPLEASVKVSESMYHGNVYAIVAAGTAEVRVKAY